MVLIDKVSCIGCGNCVGDCVGNVLSLDDGKAVYAGQCIQCGHCVAICPTNSVSIPEYDMADIEEYNEDSFKVSGDKLLRAIKFRRSIRRFKEQKIERKKLEAMVQAGRYSATGSNMQKCGFVFVQHELDTLKDMVWSGIEQAVKSDAADDNRMLTAMKGFVSMRKETGVDFLFRNAPCVLYITADSPLDAGLAAQNMEMIAVSQGLGILYNGFLQRSTPLNPEACKWLGMSDSPIQACMLVGYPEVTYKRTVPRKTADVIWK